MNKPVVAGCMAVSIPPHHFYVVEWSYKNHQSFLLLLNEKREHIFPLRREPSFSYSFAKISKKYRNFFFYYKNLKSTARDSCPFLGTNIKKNREY